jgi:hypothetical protein
MATVKGFADACYKDEKDIAKGITYPKNKESVQSCEEVVASPVKVKLKRS